MMKKNEQDPIALKYWYPRRAQLSPRSFFCVQCGDMSAPKIDIKALAALARLEVSDTEMATLENELPAILGFVEQVQKVAADAPPTVPEMRNVMRDDINPHETGLYTDRLIAAAPASEGNRVVVKQVLWKKK